MTIQPESPEPREPVGGESLSISDEVWEKFQQDSFGAIRATAPKEPSARARMVAERLRLQEAEDARRQARARPTSRGRVGGGSRRTTPRPWDGVPAARGAADVSWRERGRTLLIALAALVIATVAMFPGLLRL